MFTSETDIINRSADILGEQRLLDAGLDRTTFAQTMSGMFESVSDGFLRDNKFNCSIERSDNISSEGTAPTFEWDSAFAMPIFPYCLRVLGVWAGGRYLIPGKEWIREKRFILANTAGPIKIRYVSRITQYPNYDADVGEALAAKLAMEACMKITNLEPFLGDLKKLYEVKLADAREADSKESRDQLAFRATTWTGAR